MCVYINLFFRRIFKFFGYCVTLHRGFWLAFSECMRARICAHKKQIYWFNQAVEISVFLASSFHTFFLFTSITAFTRMLPFENHSIEWMAGPVLYAKNVFIFIFVKFQWSNNARNDQVKSNAIVIFRDFNRRTPIQLKERKKFFKE